MTIRDLNLAYEHKLTQALEAEQAQARSNKAPGQPSAERGAKKTTNPAASNPSSQSTDRSVDQSTNQSTDRSTGQLTGRVVDRPVSFYIPAIIHQKIDEAVRYYQEHHSRKIDRSAVVSALLGDPGSWTHQALDKMAGKVIEQLTSRMTSRLASRPTD